MKKQHCCASCVYWIDATAECACALGAEANGWDVPSSVEQTLEETDMWEENECEEFEE